MSGERWEQMRDELMRHTLKDLKAIAKADGISLGYDGSRKDTCVAAIVTGRRYQEIHGFVPPNHNWHDHGVTAFGGIKGKHERTR